MRRLLNFLMVPVMALGLCLAGCANDAGSSGDTPSGGGSSGTATVTGVTLSSTSISLQVGGSSTLTATVEGTNLTDTSVTWKSENTSVATVSNGKVTAVAAGTAVITAVSNADSTKSTNCLVIVTAAESGSGASGASGSGSSGSSNTVWDFSTQPSNISGTNTENTAGTVIAPTSGSGATLTLTDATDFKWSSSSVQAGKNSADYSTYATKAKAVLTLVTNGSGDLTIVMSGSGTSDASYRWIVVTNSDGTTVLDKIESSTSSENQTLSISSLAAGTYKIYMNGARIYSITSGSSGSSSTVAVTGVSLSPSTASLEITSSNTAPTVTLTATVSPSNATTKTLTWGSSVTSVATVSNGVVTAVSAGTTVITAASTNGKTATCTVTVTDSRSSGGDSGSGSSGTTNYIKASDTPVGYASVGTYTTTATTASYGSYSNPVTTRAQLIAAVKKGGLIYVKGMIDMTDDGDGTMIPTVSDNAYVYPAALDSFVTTYTSYASYSAWKTAYIAACSTDTDDEGYSLCSINSLYTPYKKLIQLDLVKNTTIIGMDSSSGIIGGTLSISSVSNVAIRNMILQDAYDPFPHHESEDGWNSQYDGVTVQGTCSGIWIDHCTFKDSLNGTDSTLDFVTNASGTKEHWNPYDGQCDMKGTISGMTVSYCKFMNHDKTMLLCSGTSDTGTKNITLTHNWFYGCKQRLPMVGIANLHAYNNYFSAGDGTYSSNDYAIGVRYAAQVISENNYFGSYIKYSYKNQGSLTGALYKSGDTDNSSSGVQSDSTLTSCTTTTKPFTVSYSYTLDTASDLPTLLAANAGAGKWTVSQ